MGIGSNKRDFERALELMKDTLVDLDISSDGLEVIYDVIREYNDCFKDDIEDMIIKVGEFEDE